MDAVLRNGRFIGRRIPLPAHVDRPDSLDVNGEKYLLLKETLLMSLEARGKELWYFSGADEN